jgi:ABC-2 type transport system ATP-binding protein
MTNAVELAHVTKTFGDFTAVGDLSLVVPAGSVYGFIGPNGSGKTTTLRMISRIYIPDHGTVKVLGEERHGAANDRVFYLPEERAIYPQMRVREALTFFAQIKGYSPTKAEIHDWLEKVGLPGVAEKRMNQLSKGMGQKVQFLAAVMAKPQLAMLDEPFSGLDPMNAVVLRDLISELRKQGTTVIFSTHDMRVAEEMCDFVFMIYKGKKVLDGTLDAIRKDYGRDVLRVKLRGARSDAFDSLPGVNEVTDVGNLVELHTTPEADTQAILALLTQRGIVERFEIASPSLQDIFVRIASPENEAMATMG